MHQNPDLYILEALDIANVAKSIREAIFNHDNFNFCGDFPSNCQKDCLPFNLKLLISIILSEPSLKSEENKFSRMSHITFITLLKRTISHYSNVPNPMPWENPSS